MIKKILLTTALLTNISAYCWDPYTAPSEADELAYLSIGYTVITCPCCSELRLFPSEEFFMNRRMKLTAKEEEEMYQAISTYDGDKVYGRLCPFCGRILLEHEGLEQLID